jgi:hypothetical protein
MITNDCSRAENKSNRTRSRLIDCVGYCSQLFDALVMIDSDFIRPPTKHVTTQWPDQWILVLFLIINRSGGENCRDGRVPPIDH